MLNEDIITSLNNAVARGESLQTAVQILINSGYEPAQVYEASRYVQNGAITNLQPNISEPRENKNIVNNFESLDKNNQYKNLTPNLTQNISKNNNQYLTQNINNNQETTEKPSYKKEIILLIILLTLIGILALTIFFKDAILSILSR